MVFNKVILVLCLTALLGVSGCSRQQSDWEKAVGANTAETYEQFLKKYPSGDFTAQAQARLKELYEERDWQKARDTDTLEGYQAFLKQYPEGKWTEEARIRVENFTLASAPTAAPAAAAAPNPAANAVAPKVAAAPKAVAATAATSKAGTYGIQLGAFKSGADAANARWAQLEKKYPKLLTGLTPKVAPKKSASGTLYRLQIANLSEKHAASICKTLKEHSQACTMLRPAHS
ncbi:MAG TPA: SPOR domain-containing protein [Steroidobacteraceae bacterium]|nr:SPOR domain-containing protein [Steroidobacteraceae bacterium]